MFKKLLLFPALLIYAFTCLAQGPAPRFSIGLNAGLAFPMGEYASKSSYSLPAPQVPGWAKTGPAVQLEFNYLLPHHLGVLLTGGYQQNSQDWKTLYHSLQEAYPNFDYYRATTNPWKIWKLMAGGYYSLELGSKKLLLEPRVQAGILHTSVPGYSTYAQTNGTGLQMPRVIYSTTKGPDLPWAFAFQLGSSLKYLYTRRVYFSAHLDYFHSTPEYKFFYTNSSGVPQGQYVMKFPVASLALNLGFGTRL